MFSGLGSFNIKTIPEDTLIDISQIIAAELMRRRGVRDSNRAAIRHVRARILGMRGAGRSAENLLSGEWDLLYPDKGGEKRFYVYAHVRPNSIDYTAVQTDQSGDVVRLPGVPFYIGKGTGNRAHDLVRNQAHGAELRGLLSGGHSPTDIVHILKDGLTESEALMLEAKLVYLLGTRFEQGINGILVNLDIPSRPHFPGDTHEVVDERSLRAQIANPPKRKKKDKAKHHPDTHKPVPDYFLGPVLFGGAAA